MEDNLSDSLTVMDCRPIGGSTLKEHLNRTCRPKYAGIRRVERDYVIAETPLWEASGQHGAIKLFPSAVAGLQRFGYCSHGCMPGCAFADIEAAGVAQQS